MHAGELLGVYELLTVLSALETGATRTISLLTTDVMTRKLVGFSRATIEEISKSFSIGTEVEERTTKNEKKTQRSRVEKSSKSQAAPASLARTEDI